MYKKRAGTTDYGSEYEKLTIANLVLRLVSDANLKNFSVSSGDEKFDRFDDVVVETETLDDITTTFALQLVHSERNVLSLKHLQVPKGNFSLKEFFRSFQRTQTLANKFILYTNRKMNIEDNTEFCLDGEDFFIKISRISPEVSILGESGCCFKFSVVDETDTISDKIWEYKRFFERFYLYASQNNAKQLQVNTANTFQKTFSADETEYSNYLKTIAEWNLLTGRKHKLTKKWAQRVIALQILSSRMHPLCFDHTDEDLHEKEKKLIMREAISSFDITVFDRQSYHRLKMLWNEYQSRLIDEREAQELIRMYQLCSGGTINDLNSKGWSELLWLMGKCPLIVTLDETVHKALELCKSEKFVLFHEHSENFLESRSIFRNLGDLKTVSTSIFDYFTFRFTCFLQGKREVGLRALGEDNEEFWRLIKTDDLLTMMDEPLHIGDVEEVLPEPYIPRHVWQDVIDMTYLDSMGDIVVVIDSVEDQEQIRTRLKREDLNYVDMSLHEDEEKQPVGGPTIYFSNNAVSVNDFDKIRSSCVKDCHHFRVTYDQNLILIRSTGDVRNLEKYKLKPREIKETTLWSMQLENTVNVIIGDSGSGKTALVKNFKDNCPCQFWIVILTPEDVYLFLKSIKDSKKDLTRDFYHYLVSVKYRRLDENGKNFFRLFFEQNNVVYVWDALDEISNEGLEMVTNLIFQLCRSSRAQSVTSRSHLKTFLETKFKVLSLSLTELNQEDQHLYIRKRLEYFRSEEEVDKVIAKIRFSLLCSDILKLPLLLFMFTEVLRDNADKDLSHFNINTLYESFVNEKLNLYFSDKINIASARFLMDKMIMQVKQSILDSYEKIALKVLFNEDFQKIDDKLEKNFDMAFSVGIIESIQDQVPRFYHDSFAAYFAAVHFAKNLHLVEKIRHKFFQPKYTTMRIFFDNILAENCLPHLAIISKNVDLLLDYSTRQKISYLDRGGRTALHLACSWGQRHPTLEITETAGTFTVNAAKAITVIPESEEYVKMVALLLQECDVSQKDEIFKMTALEYAHASECLKEELMVMERQGKGFSELKHGVGYVVSTLYYSAALGYCEPFSNFFLGRYHRKNIVGAKDVTGLTLSKIASQRGHQAIADFLEEGEAEMSKGGDRKKSMMQRIFETFF